jgi:hypothetical protein
MDSKEYKEKKLDKLVRDVVQSVNRTPSFGYGDVIDNMAKTALTSYLVTLVHMNETKDNLDIEILAQSMASEVESLTINLVNQITSYQQDISNVQ